MKLINIVLRVSKELNIPAIAKCKVINDRIEEEYGDDIKITNLPYYKIIDIDYDEGELTWVDINIINNHILQYWEDIESSIN